ncbi:MAG: hypothetical protein ABI197_10690 [Granulicella sp.]
MPKIPKNQKLTAASQFEDLDDEYIDSFRLDPTPSLIEIHIGFQMYKWAATSRHNEHGHRIRNTLFGPERFASPFWAPWAAMYTHGHQVPGFTDLRILNRNVGGSVGRPQESARAGFAVTEEWSEMNSLIKIELHLTTAWAFLGVCSEKPVSENIRDRRIRRLPGGNYQLLLPGMENGDIFKL